MKYKGVKGTRDILPPETDIWRHLESTAAGVFQTFGFREIRVPVMEETQVFTRSIGETSDIVEKEMYTFTDRGNRSVTLRPEGTAPVVRALVQNGVFVEHPASKFFYMGPMFRYERPQAGRYRQFHQIGAEAFGIDDPRLDAEILLMLTVLLDKLGLKNLDCQINSIGCPQCRPRFREAVKAFFAERLDGLCADCKRRYETNPLRIMDCKVPACVELRAGAPSVLDHLDEACAAHFRTLTDTLAHLGVPFTVKPTLVRGLDYYTRTTFEVVAGSLGAQNAVAAGGRYDKLVEEFGGPKTPAIGFALGVERMVSLLAETAPPAPRPALFIAALGEPAALRALSIASALRKSGVWAECGYSGSLKSQMRRADKLGARFTLIIGDEEVASGFAQLRNMETKEQELIGLDEAAKRFMD
ncbi:MAG: histidine--tRNA ligase [Nitrospirae bacterium]|nr:histidine--tRNA ligase [Nitrospirota bacterium]